jgi:site-specific DNA-methyltransferase (adenine-specific)
VGQSYILEKSGIYNGDADLLLPLLKPASVNLFLTDPPFNVGRANNLHTMGRRGIDWKWDGQFDQTAWLPTAVAALKPGGSMIIWNDWKNLGLIARALEELGVEPKRDLIWAKTNPFPRNRDRSYVQAREYALWAVKRGAKWTFHRRAEKGYETGEFRYPVQHSLHPSKKPDGLFRELIEIHTNPGDLIVDPYAGEGTTSCAAEVLGRSHYSFEVDENFYAAAVAALERAKTA